MTCPPPDRLDAYLAGDADDERLRQHVAGCPTCTAEAALAHRIDAALAKGRAVRAPEGLVAAALAEARGAGPARTSARPSRAGDRAPTLRSRRGRLFAASALALAAVVVAATTWATREAPRPTADQPLVADASTPPDAALVDVPVQDVTPAPSAEPTPDVSDTTPLPPAGRPDAPPQRETAPPPSAPEPDAAPEAAAPHDTTPEPIAQAEDAEPSPAEVERAADDLRLAFALVADAQRRAGRALRDEAGPVVSTIDHALPF